MKAIMISIQPKHVANILNGKKTVEVRKTFPKEYLIKKCFEAYTVYIYCTKGKPCLAKSNETKTGLLDLNGKVVARFDLIGITPIHAINANYWTDEACITEEEMQKYLNGGKGYLWHIDNLQVFNNPRELSDFKTKHYPQFVGMVKNKTHYELRPLSKSPQSWCYVEENQHE